MVGASKDSVKRHDRFKAKYELGFPLVSDEAGGMVEAYESWVEKALMAASHGHRPRDLPDRPGAGKIVRIRRKVKVPATWPRCSRRPTLSCRVFGLRQPAAGAPG